MTDKVQLEIKAPVAVITLNKPDRLNALDFQACFSRLETCRVPVVAAIQRCCIGGGLELALCCDVRLAAEGTVFSIPEAQVGIVPDMGGTQRLPRTVGVGKAKELI